MIDIMAWAIVLGLFGWGIHKALKKSKQSDANLNDGQQYIETLSTKEGVQQLSGGVLLEIISASGKAHQPSEMDRISVHYHGTLIDGTVFDSSVQRGEPLEFQLNQVIPGWQIGLKAMNEGDKARLVIPSELAYGRRKVGKIMPNSTLIFEVELLQIG